MIENLNNKSKQIWQIQNNFKVQVVHQQDGILDQVGVVGKNKNNRLEEALKELIEYLEDKENARITKTIPLDDGLIFKILKYQLISMIREFQQKYQIRINVQKDEISLHGIQKQVLEAQNKLEELIKSIKQTIETRTIKEKNYKMAISKIGVTKLQQTYSVKITYVDSENENSWQSNQYSTSGIKGATSNQILFQWSYKVDSGDSNYAQRHDKVNNYFNFDSDQNWQIETFYKKCCNEKNFNQSIKLVGDNNEVKNGFIYEVKGSSADPNTWTETNLQTKRSRQLKRLDLAGQKNGQEEEKKESQNQNNSNASVSYYKLRGLSVNLDKLQLELEKYCSDSNNFKEILSISPNFVNENQEVLKEIDELIQTKYQCKIQISQDKLIIIGFQAQKAKFEIEKIIENIKKYNFPSNWTQTMQLLSNSKQIQLIDLKPESQEFTTIVTNFKKTLPQAQIIKVVRIQNKALWKIYQAELENVKDRWNKPVKELHLYHGTRSSDPKLIYDGEEGFDLRFSSGGMWGTAVYFAVNSSYSNGYAFTSSAGKQMFYAKVQVGNFKTLNPDGSLKMPPLMEGSQNRYDSVQGHTGGSDVFMVYANKKAYPEYLITYK